MRQTLTGQCRRKSGRQHFAPIFTMVPNTDDDIVDVFVQRLTTPFNIYKSVFIPVGVYNWTRHQLTYGSAENRKWTINFFERFGGYYDGSLSHGSRSE